MRNIYDILEDLTEQYEDTFDFQRWYENECDNTELIELVCERFNLDSSDDDMDYYGAFLEIFINLDYQEMDYHLFVYGEYEEQGTEFIKEFINDNYNDIKENIEEYLAVSE